MKPTFESTQDGLEIIDPIERHRYRLTTYESVTPQSVSCDQIRYPVDAAVEILTDGLSLPTNETVYVHDKDGKMIAEVRPTEQVSLPQGEYVLDLSGPLKVYASVESVVRIYSDTKQTHITLNSSTRAVIGARSYHTRPAGTITTTTAPTDMMQAVSMFGSALKTTGPERSYPTLRGHPPAIELGDELHIPEKFERPNTGIQIVIRPTLEHIFVVAPLAYYLGAEVIPGPRPQIITETGYTYELDSDASLEETIERLLKHVFFLDCIVRTEGTSPGPLYERQEVKPILEFDIATVYEKPLTEQLETYLKMPFSILSPYLPKWRLETNIKPSADKFEFVPFLSNELSLVKIRNSNEPSMRQSEAQTRAIEEFTRGNFTRGTSSNRGDQTISTHHNKQSISTIQQSWGSTGTSKIRTTTPLSSFYNSIGRTPRTGPIEIKVVCNDPDMQEELETVNSYYGAREELPFDVAIYHDLETDDLERILAQDTDFFHYIGHIDESGFQCADGKLDAASLNKVGAMAFLLNACQSHDQGLHLVEAGSIGGIVTLGDVVNNGAVSVGSTIARLLNRGFPLYAALDIARKKNVVGQQYRIVGDGITTVAQSKMGVPNVCSVTRKNNNIYVEMFAFMTAETGRGSLFTPYLEPVDSYYLVPGNAEQVSVTEAQLKEFFRLEESPVLIDGTIHWSENIIITDL